MKYFFILGNNPALSLAELYSVFNGSEILSVLSKEIAALKTSQSLDPDKIIRKLGGIIKLGLLTAQSKPDAKELIQKIKKLLEPKPGKFKFGLSYYGPKKLELRKIGMAVKTDLKNAGHSVRFVTSRGKTLSSVVVEQNKLATKGQEIILIRDNNKILLGRTLAVQPFKELSFRDYGRPARDDRSGMLPPKLAQIMINLAQADANQAILDPFCGSGTILSEALLMGYKNLIGSDNSPQAILDSKKNIRWTATKFNTPKYPLQIFQSDAAKLNSKIPAQSISAIITEPYLGPQRGGININKTIPQLEKLYSRALKEFKKILKPNGKIIMVWPRFCLPPKTREINPNTSGYKFINPLPAKIINHEFIKLTSRNTLLYGRSGQRVWREIIILKIKK